MSFRDPPDNQMLELAQYIKSLPSNFEMFLDLSGAIITDVSGKVAAVRALQEGCEDVDGRYHSVGEEWRIDGGYCDCYEPGKIGCVGDAPPRRLPSFS